MKSRYPFHRTVLSIRDQSRRGSILVLSAVFMVVLFAFMAFTMDLGYIALTKTQIQTAADASALASGMELISGLDESATTNEVIIAASAEAVFVAAAHPSGNLDSAYVDQTRDIRFGQLTWDLATGTWNEAWGVAPYNLVEVTLRRDQASSNSPGDQPLPLFVGPAIHHSTADLSVKALAALLPAGGFKIIPGSTEVSWILPITMDEATWIDQIENGNGPDEWSYDPDTGAVTAGPDGIPEADIFPIEDDSVPAGNRGLIDFGSDNNSAADISRQITGGITAFDMAYIGGEIILDGTTRDLNGDTGLTTSIKSELSKIIGEPRAVALFTHVQNPGNNATYTLVRFVGIRIMVVDLVGNTKQVMLQPAAFVDNTAVRATAPTTIDSGTVFAPIFLYK